MKRCWLLGAGILVLAGWLALEAPAGDGSHEGLVKDMLTTLEQITKTLGGVKDADGATAARPELKKAAEKMLALRKQADEAKQPSQAERDRLAKDYGPKFEEAVKLLHKETFRVKGIKNGAEAVAELDVLKDKENPVKEKKDGK